MADTGILILFKRVFLTGLFSGSLFLEGLNTGGKFAFQDGLGLTIKTALNAKITSLKQVMPKTANPNGS